MPFIRFTLDLAIPENVYNALPAAKKTAARDIIRELKSYARKINEGAANEEMTIVAKWHRCLNDEGKSCEEEKDI